MVSATPWVSPSGVNPGAKADGLVRGIRALSSRRGGEDQHERVGHHAIRSKDVLPIPAGLPEYFELGCPPVACRKH